MIKSGLIRIKNISTPTKFEIFKISLFILIAALLMLKLDSIESSIPSDYSYYDYEKFSYEEIQKINSKLDDINDELEAANSSLNSIKIYTKY